MSRWKGRIQMVSTSAYSHVTTCLCSLKDLEWTVPTVEVRFCKCFLPQKFCFSSLSSFIGNLAFFWIIAIFSQMCPASQDINPATNWASAAPTIPKEKCLGSQSWSEGCSSQASGFWHPGHPPFPSLLLSAVSSIPSLARGSGCCGKWNRPKEAVWQQAALESNPGRGRELLQAKLGTW